MINEKNLRDALVALATQQLTQYETYQLLSEQVAALQDTVRGLDPTFDDILAQKRADRSSQISEAVIAPSVKAELVKIVRLLKTEGFVC